MRVDALVHLFDEATGRTWTVQIPYAVPDVCRTDPDTLIVRSTADGKVVYATTDWIWAETDLPPAPDDRGLEGGSVAVRFQLPTGEERGIWCQSAVALTDAQGRPYVVDARTRHPLGLFRRPIDVLCKSPAGAFTDNPRGS
jgi:hypothetical protein